MTLLTGEQGAAYTLIRVELASRCEAGVLKSAVCVSCHAKAATELVGYEERQTDHDLQVPPLSW